MARKSPFSHAWTNWRAVRSVPDSPRPPTRIPMPSANAPSATSSGTPRWTRRRRRDADRRARASLGDWKRGDWDKRRTGGGGASARLPRDGGSQAALTEDLPARRSTVICPDDRDRLDHCRLHARDGGLGLCPGTDRWRAVGCRLRRGGVPGLAAGAAAPVGALEVAVRAFDGADGRAGDRRDPGVAV